MDAIQEPPTADAASASRWRVGPPGWLYTLATTVAILITLDGISRLSGWLFMLGVSLYLGLAWLWIGRFVVAAYRTKLRMPVQHWARWLAIPVMLAIGYGVAGAAADVRLELSRNAMDTLAADVMAGRTTERDWVGLYPVSEVEPTADGVRFTVESGWLSRWGFAYASSGEPDFIPDEDEDAGLWTVAWFEPIGDGWFRWTESWD